MAQAAKRTDFLHTQVRAMARRGAIPHAVILSGSGDREDAARFLAAAALCRSESDKPCLQCPACRKVLGGIHPDVRFVRDTEHRELPMDLVRSLRQDVYIRPNEEERKVYVFPDCEQLNERDQNVLLKVVEEGPPYAVFVFCTATAAALLPTVRSRCVEWKLRGDEVSPADELSDTLCRLFARRELLPAAEFLVEQENRHVKRERLELLLENAWQICAAALLSAGKDAPSVPDTDAAALLRRNLSPATLQKLADRLRYYAAQCRYNVGVGHILGALCADWDALLHEGGKRRKDCSSL
ncbi:MAG: DNA polymerase III subunit delta' [Oscillospiraceae bacterium]|nr:DNA polymerase III subunit delta' [Oscillospiraceae bacterium]